MILVNRALERLEAEGKPIRVGMVGAGFMARGVALQLIGVAPGIELVAVSNRSVVSARRAYTDAGVDQVTEVTSVAALDAAIEGRRSAITEDPFLMCEADGIDVIFEATGAVEFAAQVLMAAITHGKHVVTMNAELDATAGPILKAHADRAGVVLSGSEGDQPGVIMNLYEFVRGIGVKPVLCGNIKGLQDPYRNPTTQEAFAKRWGQNPHMVTSFADGTKISFEQAIVANATGMGVGQRGMFGPEVDAGTPIEEAVDWYPLDAVLEGPGIVDYVVGASPNPGVFVLGTHDHPAQQHYLHLYKLGEGPLYCFYTPYHLCHFEVHNGIARAAIFGDATISPRAGLQVEVVATAKTDLKAGHVLDGLGGYDTYGQAENAGPSAEEGLLPMGLAEGCRLVRNVRKDSVLTYDAVELPPERVIDRLRQEQAALFGRPVADSARPSEVVGVPTETDGF